MLRNRNVLRRKQTPNTRQQRKLENHLTLPRTAQQPLLKQDSKRAFRLFLCLHQQCISWYHNIQKFPETQCATITTATYQD